MIAILLIALAAGCCVGADVRLDHLGRADLAAAVLSGAAAADGGGARMGPARGHHRRHRRGFGLGAIFGLPYLPRLCRSRSRCRPGGSDISRCWAGRRPLARRQATASQPCPRRWNGIRSAASCSGSRALPSLTTIAALLTLGTDAATITGTIAPRPAADPSGSARRRDRRRYRTIGRCASWRSRRLRPRSSP